MKILSQKYGWKRSLGHGLIIAATAVATIAIRADNERDAARTDKQHSEKYSDASFIKEAAQADLTEVKLGEIASQMGQNSQVKSFGQQLVRDHGQNYNELKQIAQKQGITLAADLDQKHQQMVSKLQSQSGDEFDKAFAKHMVKDHQKDIKKFERAVNETQDTDVKMFAQKTLPTLREHLDQAKTVAQAVGIPAADLAALTSEDESEASGTAGSGTSTGTGTSQSDRDKSDSTKPYQSKSDKDSEGSNASQDSTQPK